MLKCIDTTLTLNAESEQFSIGVIVDKLVGKRVVAAMPKYNDDLYYLMITDKVSIIFGASSNYKDRYCYVLSKKMTITRTLTVRVWYMDN